MFWRRTPLISILLPTHNRADVLPYAIEAVLAQTVEHVEILVVGDGCTDHTAEVVQSFRDRRIRWFDLPKAPHFGYANRNLALKQARGTYIAFMAHDDLILPDHLERCLEPLEANTALELVYTRPLWVTPDGLIIPVAYNLYNSETFDLFISRRVNGIPASCVVHRRACFDKYGYWKADLPSCGDWDMWVRIIEGGGGRNFAFIPEPTCLHFRAIWRTEANAGPEELVFWRSFYERTACLPAALKVKIPEDVPEQQVLWESIARDPVGWSAQVRQAVVQILDQRVADIHQRRES